MRVLKTIDAGLRRLFKDEGGNTFVIVAAAVIPLMGVVGGGLDLARAHLAKSRLSQACDAAALAGRRAMTNDDIETAKPESNKFFNYNFPQGYMETTAFTPVITKPERGSVQIVASTTVPTTIMKIFNSQSLPISVNCQATQNFDNIDIVLVLDVTGSMDQTLGSEKKIVSLRKAVMALYDELDSAQTELQAQGLRLRYSIVPYSMTVNVGRLVRAKNPSYIANNWTYQSRTWNGSSWNYGPKSIDVSSYVTTSAWNGCIEERKTTSNITASSSTSEIPPEANDLNIDMVPDGNQDTKWGPHYPSVVYWPGHSSPRQEYCPREARRLGAMTRDEMNTYVNALTPVGGTYHDIGMIWGARMISRGGIFSAENPAIFNDRPVNRYVIFMTDGDLAPNSDQYVAYGVEMLDRRIVGGTYGTSVASSNGSDLEKRHTVRFQMACNAAKSGGASIWAIAFSDDVKELGPLQSCASSDDQFALSEDSSDLIEKFQEIGRNIGALRLKQ